jgi:3-hydroxybutyryl-CoA dehydratase
MTAQKGQQLAALEKQITQDVIDGYAEASGDFNPLHTDPELGRTTAFGSTVAHGMLLFGYVSEMLTVSYGRDWASTGSLDLRFRRPARPGDTVTVSGRVTAVDEVDGAEVVRLAVECRLGDGTVAALGTAGVKRGVASRG